MLTYKVDDSSYWPGKDEANPPKHQDMLPMFDKDVPVWKRYLTFGQLNRKFLSSEDYITFIPSLGKYCVVRKFIVHDWASIPGLLRVFTSPTGVLACGALPHDNGYRYRGLFLATNIGDEFVFTRLTRKEIDLAMRSLNDRATKLKALNTTAYYILRGFGFFNFKAYDVTKVDWTKPY